MKKYLRGFPSLILILALAIMSIMACEEKSPREKAAEDIKEAAESIGDVFKNEKDKIGKDLKDIGEDIKETTNDIIKKDQ